MTNISILPLCNLFWKKQNLSESIVTFFLFLTSTFYHIGDCLKLIFIYYYLFKK